MRKRPFFFIGLASFLCVVMSALFSHIIGVVAAVITTLFLLVLTVIRRFRLSPRTATVACLCVITVTLLFSLRITKTVEPLLDLDGTTATVTMRVTQTVAVSCTYIAEVEEGTLEKGTKLCFWTGYHTIAPQCGDLLTAEVELVAAYDRERESGSTAKANGVFLYAWPTKDSELCWEDGQDTLTLPQKAVYALRDAIHNMLYRHTDFDTAALAEGMMLGRRDNLSAEVVYTFRTSGVYHLLAVSGVHLSIITGAMLMLLRALPRRSRALLTMGVIVLFTGLCGFTASVMRAGAMTLLMLDGQLFSRRTDGLNSLGFAAVTMLLMDPFCIYDIGWQLSFAATLGLLLFLPVWEREITARAVEAMSGMAFVLRPVSAAVGVSLCASLTTMPLCALYFGGISTVFLLGNLVCVPLSSVLLLVFFSAVMTAWLTPLSNILFTVGEWLSRLLTLYTARLASLPFAMVATNTLVVVWLFLLLGAIVCGYMLYRMRGVLRAVAVMLVILIVGCGLHTVIYKDVSRIAAASSEQITVTVRTGDTCGLIVAANGKALSRASTLLYQEGIASLDWVLWLCEPSDCTVELSALTVPIGRLLVSASPDGFRSLPAAREITVMEEGGALTFGDNASLMRRGGFYRLCIGETAYLFAVDDSADADTLPPAWCENETLFLQALPKGLERITAEHTIVFCAHGEREEFPDAAFAIEGEVRHILTRGDGNITLHR